MYDIPLNNCIKKLISVPLRMHYLSIKCLSFKYYLALLKVIKLYHSFILSVPVYKSIKLQTTTQRCTFPKLTTATFRAIKLFCNLICARHLAIFIKSKIKISNHITIITLRAYRIFTLQKKKIQKHKQFDRFYIM